MSSIYYRGASTLAPHFRAAIALPTGVMDDFGHRGAFWWDITAYLRNIETIEGGRQRDLDTIEAGHATLTIDNWDRTFEPNSNPSGGFGLSGLIKYGGLGAGGGFNQHVRILAGYLGEMLGNRVADSPTQWWRMDDRGRVSIAKNELESNTASGRDGVYSGSPDLGGRGFLRGKTCFNADGTDDYMSVTPLASETFLDLSTSFAIGIVIAPDTLPASAAGLVVRANAGDANPGQYNLLLTSAGEIQYLSGTGATVTTTGAGITAGGGPYVIVVNYESTLSPKCEIYVNGVLRGSGNPDTPVVSSTKALLFGRRGTGGFFDGRMAEGWIAKGSIFSQGTIQDCAAEYLAGHADGYVFYGYADGWPQSYPRNGNDAIVELEATDAFKIFANIDLPPSPFALEMEMELAATARGWWRLGEQEGSLKTYNNGPGVFGTAAQDVAVAIGGTPNWVGGLVVNDDNGGVTLPDGVYLKLPSGSTIGGSEPGYFSFGGTQFVIDALIQRDGAPTSTQVVFDQTGGGNQIRCTLRTDGTLQFTVTIAGLLFTATTTLVITDGLPHHVRFHRRAVNGPTGTIKIYVDGVERASTACNNIGGVGGASYATVGPFDGVLDELIIEDTSDTSTSFEGTFTETEMFSHMRTPWSGKTTTQAATRILDWIGWPAGKRDIGTGETILGTTSFDDKVLTTLQRFAETENSIMYMAPDGKFTFYGRDAYVTPGLVAGYGQGDVRARFGNLVDNWTFETDMTGWTVDSPGAWDEFTGYHGTHSVFLVDNSAVATKKLSQVGDPITLRPGQAYRISAWVLPQGTTSKAVLLFRYSDGSADGLVAKTVIPNIWQRIVTEVPFVSSGKLTGHIEVYPTDASVVAEQGSMFVDAIELTLLPYVEPVTLFWDEVNIHNVMRFAREGGTERVLEDDLSVTEHGERSLERNTLHQNEEEMIDQMNWLLDQRSNPELELRSLTIRPATEPELWHEVINRRFGDKIKVWVQHPGYDDGYLAVFGQAGDPIVRTVRIQQISHSANLKAETWETTWQLSAAEDDQPWLLGNTTWGILGTTTKLGY